MRCLVCGSVVDGEVCVSCGKRHDKIKEPYKVVRVYDQLLGANYLDPVTTLELPDGADGWQKHCYKCQKVVWLVGNRCSECGDRIA